MPLLFSSHFINLTDFIGEFTGGHPAASSALNKKKKKAKVRETEEGKGEEGEGEGGVLRSARCIVPRSFVLLPF